MLPLLFLAGLALAAAQPNMSCATNGLPCAPPTWAPQWELVDSTICQPSADDFFQMPADKPWGLVSLDWSVARNIWNKNGPHNASIEAISREGCRLLKANHSATKCFIYHNMELALESIESQRAAMYPGEPSYNADFFLQYPNGTIYNERQTPGDQFFWNYSRDETKAYYRDSVLASINYPEVDGTFTDDVSGIPDEHGSLPARLGLTAAQVDHYRYETSIANQMLIDAAVAAGKYVWAAFGAQDGVAGGPSRSTCASWMRARCSAAWQARATTQSIDAANFNQSIAAFLVVRPPIGMIGYGWESDMRDWHEEFLWQVGAPTPAGAICTESPAGVFSRPWTHGVASLDCNTWTATIPAV